MIIFINGSINSGKSTLAKILAERLKNTAVIEVDLLRHFITWMSLKEAIPINLENTCSLIKNFVKHKLNVIIPYPLSQQNYEYIKVKLENSTTQLFFFTLNPELEEVVKNRGHRKLTDKEVARIRYHYETGINNPKFGITIDNTNLTPEETSLVIFKFIKKNISF